MVKTDEEVRDEWIKWKAEKRNPLCLGCEKFVWEADGEYYYTVNPPGGYGRDELLICNSCIKKDEYKGIYERLRYKIHPDDVKPEEATK